MSGQPTPKVLPHAVPPAAMPPAAAGWHEQRNRSGHVRFLRYDKGEYVARIVATSDCITGGIFRRGALVRLDEVGPTADVATMQKQCEDWIRVATSGDGGCL